MESKDLIVIVCPSCSQKYRVPEARIGQRAMCKKCGQRFRIAMEAPIDEDTLFGWVMEGDPGSQSVAGSTAIFDSPVSDVPQTKAPAPRPPASRRFGSTASMRSGRISNFRRSGWSRRTFGSRFRSVAPAA